MKCSFWSKIHPVCKLGLYGGMPSYGICEKCISNNENNEKFAKEIKTRFEKSHPSNVNTISGCCDSAQNYIDKI
jgi:hypothetical protein